ncbi:hypothetical protein AB4406_25915, partial [Vibrio splendidus]
ETVEGRRNIRLAERYFVDTNMLLNLPPFVSYIFTATEVPKPSLISPIKVKKSTLENFEAVRQREQKESTPSPNIEPIDKDFVDEVREKIWAVSYTHL